MFGKQASFRFLWFGQMFANLGDVLYIVCVIKLIHDTTGSVTYMSLVPFLNTSSLLISGFLAPLVINKYKLQSILFYTQSGKTVLLLVLCFIAPFIHLKILYLIFILICFIAFLDGWASPARNALIPNLVEDSKLVKTNSLLAISDQVVQLIAWPIGSILLFAWGGKNILWLTFSLFVVSTAFMWFIGNVANLHLQEKQSRLNALKEGWSIIWQTPRLRTISFMNILETMANGVWIAAILFVYVSEALHKGENWWGFINATFFAGMLFSGIFIYRYSNVLEKNLGKTMLWSSCSLIIITTLFGTTSIPWFALFVSFIYGFPQMARDVAETTIIQKSVNKQHLAKVYSARGTLIYGAFGISSLIMGWVTDQFGVRVSFIFAAVLFLFSYLVAQINKRSLFMVTTEEELNESLYPE
ncbi:MFS transporter [Neobacillus massiliamazoniensis]|nr:MFS transporter [Neobacillus massiliamazoniensis]